MRAAALTFAAVLAALTVLIFALDGQSGVGDELLNVIAAAGAAATVGFATTQPAGGRRRIGVATGAATVAIIVAVVAVRAAS